MSFGSGFGGFGQSTNNQNTASSPFGGFGQNTQNQNTGGFGQTGNTGFGSTGSTNTGGSLFGGGGTPSGGFGSGGGFGTAQNKPAFGSGSTGGSLFGGGQTQNQTSGFGGFGSSTTTQPTSGFGSTNTGGGLFGQQQNTQQPSTGFGQSTGGSLFGGGTSQPAGGFGQTSTGSSGFGQSTPSAFGQSAGPPANNGTGTTPFSAHNERDPSGSQQVFQNIVCQQPYQAFSQEELRSVDYNQGRRYGNQSGQAGAFGQSTGFGGFGSTPSTNTGSTNTGFGASTGGGLFGQQQNQTSGFGQQTATSGFGSSNGGGLFGQSKPAGGGLFGNNTTTSQPQTGGGLFGASGTSGGFGQGTGGFGSSTNTGGGLFGNTNQNQTQQNQQKPSLFGGGTAGGFGSSTTTTGGFGQQNQGASGGLFGNTQNQQQSTPFGQPAQTSTPFGGGFGQNQNQAQPQNQQQQGTSLFGGGFGQNNQQNQQKPGGLFGNSTTGTSGGGLFGQSNNQQQPQQQTGGLFGQNNQQNQSGGLFGQQQNQNKPSLFGSTNQQSNNGGGLFGGSFGQNQQSQQPQGGGLFGQTQNQSKPSLFGNTNQQSNTGGGLFGGSFGQNQQQQPQNQGSSLFGQSNQQQQQPQMGGSLFGNSQQNQQQQPQQPQYLTASINSELPYGNDQLFASLGTPQQSVGPLITPLSSSQKPKPRASLINRINLSASTRYNTPQKRSGYGFDYSTYGTPGSAYSNNSPMGRSLLAGGSLGRSLNKSVSMSNMRASYEGQDSILAPGAFSANGLRSSSAGRMKKLNINRSLRNDLFGTDGATDSFRASPLKKRVSFDADPVEKEKENQPNGNSSNALVPRREEDESSSPSAEEQGYLRSSRERSSSSTNGAPARKEMEQVRGNELAVVPEDDTPPPQQQPPPSRATKSAAEIAKASQKDMVPGDYWTIPSRAEVEKMSRKDRANIAPFTVGRDNCGKIEFQKVDLSNVDLNKITGDIVRLDVRVATVYADHAHKPEPGHEMNFPATITLDNSWPRSKGGKLPVYERKGPRFDKHIDRLKRVKDTRFIKYDVEHGQWVFSVDHFSTYTFDYSDDESSMLSPAPSSRAGGRSGLMPRSSLPQEEQDGELSASGSSRRESEMDDTFEFRNSKTLPGAFDGDETGLASNDGLDYTHSNVGDEDGEPIPSVEPQDSSIFDEAPMADDFSTLDGARDDLATFQRSGHLISPLKTTPLKPARTILKSPSKQDAGHTPMNFGRMKELDWTSQLQRTLSPKKQNRTALRESNIAFLKNQRKAPIKGSEITKEHRPFATSIDLMNSLFGKPTQADAGKKQTAGAKDFQWPNAKRHKSSESDTTDTEEAFPQPLKPSWAANGMVAHFPPSKGHNGRMTTTAPVTTAGRDVSSDTLRSLAEEKAPSTLHKLRQISKVRHAEGVPFAEARKTLTFGDMANVVVAADPATKHEKLMWRLASLLFDEHNGSELGAGERKQAVSELWQEIAAEASKAQISKINNERNLPLEELALIHLSACDIWNATEALIAAGDHHLSAMAAQIGSGEEGEEDMRQAVSDQIGTWRESNTISEISPVIRALYELLAGNTCTSTGKTGAGPENRAETFNISKRFGLDWRRSFGLRMWFATSGEDSLSQAIEMYARDVAAYRENVTPVPWFVEHDVNTGWDDPKREERQDILFGLLKLYALVAPKGTEGWLTDRVKLADIISPEALAGNPVDNRLTFLLLQMLLAHEIEDFSEVPDEHDAKADTITTDYAFQLSGSPDNLVDAVFVTMHLHDLTAREQGIKALLNRYAGAIGDDSETCATFKSLVTELKIPANWVWRAKALHAKSVLGSDVKECRFLLAAGDKDTAHGVFIDSVGPRCVVEEDRRTMSELLELFRENGVTSLSAYSNGASTFEDYLHVMHIAEKGGDAQDGLKIAKELGHALVEMEGNASLQVRVAAHEMANDVARAIETFQRRLGHEIRSSKKLLPDMPMASHEVLNKVEEMRLAFYRGLEMKA